MKRESGRTTTAILMITGFVLLSLILLTILFIVKKDGQLINILLSTALLVSFSIIGVLTVFLFRRKRITNNSLANSLNSIENTNEEVFEVGTILFDENQKIIFMSP
jgi:c-di-AMP phosphodiesterase-like protein